MNLAFWVRPQRATMAWSAYENAVTRDPIVLRPTKHMRQQIRLARDNGPRGRQDRGKVFQGGKWGIYVGTEIVLRSVREGCYG